MDVTTRDGHLYRLAAAAGVGSALILILNAAKRADVIPTSAATQLVAPLAEILAMALVVGLFVAVRQRAGPAGAISFVINFLALGLLVGVEVVINLVFAAVDAQTVAELRGGPLGALLAATSVLFLVGSLSFVGALLLAGGTPTLPLILYGAGSVPVALRAVVPEWALDAGLIGLALGVAALSAWLWRHPGVLQPAP
jgi:hypothetical protein